MRFTKLFEDSNSGATIREHLRRIIATQDIEFQAHGIEMDLRYNEEAAAIVPDGSEAIPRDPLGKLYVPVTRPGHRLPHAWLEHEGKAVSTHDLVGRNNLLLITDEYGHI